MLRHEALCTSCDLHSRNVPQHFLRSIRFTHLLTHKSLRDFLFTHMESEKQKTRNGGLSVQVRCDQAVGIFWQFTFFWGTPHWVRDQVVSWQSSEKLVHFLEFRKITLVNWDISLFRHICTFLTSLTGNLHNNVETWHSQVSTLCRTWHGFWHVECWRDCKISEWPGSIRNWRCLRNSRNVEIWHFCQRWQIWDFLESQNPRILRFDTLTWSDLGNLGFPGFPWQMG